MSPVPHCRVVGRKARTEKEAIANIQIAIQEYLAAIDDSLKKADVREIEVPV